MNDTKPLPWDFIIPHKPRRSNFFPQDYAAYTEAVEDWGRDGWAKAEELSLILTSVMESLTSPPSNR